MINRIALVLVLVFCFSFLFADEEKIFGEMSLEELLNQNVITASQKAEPLAEAPVIVNIITDKMIERMGAKTLKDVLVTVPGFSYVQDHNEINVSARGIYGSSQQKILILRNGHRLNCRHYSEANPDYSISLANVERIEIMRGPGSSLYGNVALTAVVNIITKSGSDINGLEGSVGGGNFGQQKYDVVYGSSAENMDILLFGSLYRSEGEKVHLEASQDYSTTPNAGDVIINGVKDKPAYDMGLEYKVSDVNFSFSQRYCHYITPRSSSGNTGEIREKAYENYPMIFEEGPGLSSKFTHAEIKYNPHINNISVTIVPYYDDSRIGFNGVISDSLGKVALCYWSDRDIGIKSYAFFPYSILGKGNILLGVQAERMTVWDSKLFIVDQWDADPVDHGRVLKLGMEDIYSTYCQLKHKFNSNLILNTGIRYDYKKRATGDPIYALSPRIAFIYIPFNVLNFKISYTKSFVDAPYWYRYCTLSSYLGGETLTPEFMQSYQFSAAISPLKYLTARMNVFYNNLTDLIFRNTAITPARYTNAGFVKSTGAEFETEIYLKAFSMRANYTYQYGIDAEGYGMKNHMILDIPAHMANVIIDFAPLYNLNKDLWMNVNVQYLGKQQSPIGNDKTLAAGIDMYNPEHIVNAVILYNAGITLQNLFVKNLGINIHINNILNKEYYQGGSVSLPYRQPGRWIYASIKYKI